MMRATSIRGLLAGALALAAAACGPGAARAQVADADAAAAAPAENAPEPPLDLSTPLPEAQPADGWSRSTDSWLGEEAWRREPWRPYAQSSPADRFTAARRPDNGWEAKVGIDGSAPAVPFQPDQPIAGVPREAPGAVSSATSGAAWANVTAPGLDLPLSWDRASVETRLDPAQDQGKLGTTFSRSVPFGQFSLTLQNGFSVTQTLAAGAPAAPAPASGTPAAAATQVFGNSETLRLGILPTDTTLALGAARSSTDDKWLRSVGAEQKLFGGPFSVSGSVNETASGELSKSIKAGFKHAW